MRSEPEPTGLETSLQELVLVLKVGEHGARIRDLYVDYRADGEPATLHLTWAMVACGNEIQNRQLC